jgi:hypothetical protein
MRRLENNETRNYGAENHMGRSHGIAGSMGRWKKKIFLPLTSVILLTACGGRARDEGADSPKEAAQVVMHSIKELDLKTFNAYTDNYEGICWDFIGFPAEKEYKVFQELLQPHIFESKRYKEKQRFARKAVEELTWEIGTVREEEGGKKASIQMTLTNRDMAEVIDRYTTGLIEDIVRDAGGGAIPFIHHLSLVNECDDDLIRFMDEIEDTHTQEVTVTAYKEGGRWKLQLSEEFINGFMGDIYSEE